MINWKSSGGKASSKKPEANQKIDVKFETNLPVMVRHTYPIVYDSQTERFLEPNTDPKDLDKFRIRLLYKSIV